jgi:hypothetical protein
VNLGDSPVFVGILPSAKGFGSFRMYAIKPRR